MWPTAEQTDHLLADAKANQADAVDRILTAFREPLRRVIGLRLDPVLARRVDASDIVQDVLIDRTASWRFTLLAPARRFSNRIGYSPSLHPAL